MNFELLILLKLITTILFVLVLSYLAEHVSPEFSGIISGIPTGGAIILFFFGFENGVTFAANSTVFNLAAMIGLHVSICVYYVLSKTKTFGNIAISSILCSLAYLLTVYLLSFVKLNIFASMAIAVASILFFSYYFDHIKDTKIAKPAVLNFKSLLFRAFISAGIVLLITGFAASIGEKQAGLLSAFPTTVLPLLIIIHAAYGSENVHTIIKNIPRGSWAMLIYMVGVHFLYVPLGIYLGSIVCYGTVIIYLFILHFYKNSKSS